MPCSIGLPPFSRRFNGRQEFGKHCARVQNADGRLIVFEPAINSFCRRQESAVVFQKSFRNVASRNLLALNRKKITAPQTKQHKKEDTRLRTVEEPTEKHDGRQELKHKMCAQGSESNIVYHVYFNAESGPCHTIWHIVYALDNSGDTCQSCRSSAPPSDSQDKQITLGLKRCSSTRSIEYSNR